MDQARIEQEQLDAQKLREEVDAARQARANRNSSRPQSTSSMAAVDKVPAVSSASSPTAASQNNARSSWTPLSRSPGDASIGTASASPNAQGFSSPHTQKSMSAVSAFTGGRTFQPKSTSFPVFAGREIGSGDGASDERSSSPRSSARQPMPLAHFIGGDQSVKGPRLNRHRPELMDGAGLETDDVSRPTATFLSRMLQHGQGMDEKSGARDVHDAQAGSRRIVALPGMVRPDSAGPSFAQTKREQPFASDAAPVDSSTTEPKLRRGASEPLTSVTASASTVNDASESVPPLSHPTALENPGELDLPSRSSTLPTLLTKPSGSTTSPVTAGPPLLASKPTKPRSERPSRDSESSDAIASDFGPSKDMSSSKPDTSGSTPSLTRLQGSNLVKERLKWGEAQSQSAGDASPGISVAPKKAANDVKSSISPLSTSASADQTRTEPQKKRSSVLDRYPVPSSPNSRGDSQDSSSSYKASYGVAASPAQPSARLSQTTETKASDARQRSRSETAGLEDDFQGMNMKNRASNKSADHVAPSAADAGFDDDHVPKPPSSLEARSSSGGGLDYKATYGVASRTSSGTDKPKVTSTSPTPSPLLAQPADRPASSARSAPLGPREQPMKSSSSTDYKSSYGLRQPGGGIASLQQGSTVTSPPNAPAPDYKSSYGVGIARTASPLPFGSASGPGYDDNSKSAAGPSWKSKSGSSSGSVTSSNLLDSSKSDASPGPSRTLSPGSASGGISAASTSPTDYKASYGVGVPRGLSGNRNAASKPSSASSAGAGGLPIAVSPVPYHRTTSPTSASQSRNNSTGSASFQPSNTSFPVSSGLAPSGNRPMSLAHFIGGKQTVTGPVLNRVRPEENESHGLEIDYGDEQGKQRTFLNNPSLLQEAAKRKGKVPLPGMVRSPSPSAAPQPTPTAGSEPAINAAAKEPSEDASSNHTPTLPLPLPGHASPVLPLPGTLEGDAEIPEMQQSQVRE